MRSKKRVTHLDVAKHAGVSTAVVSYVINNGPRPTSPEVRERVIKAIRDLDYHPNAVARGLRARRTNTIGFIVNDYSPLDVFVSSYSAKILTGLTARLKSHKHYVLVYPMVIGEDLDDVALLLRSGRLDGVVVRLVQDPPETDALLELIRATHIPCVCIERPGAARFGFSSVTYDDRRGADDATSYLIAQGHRCIGHICGDLRYSTARARLDGYRRALTAHGIAVDENLIVGDDWDPATARAGVAQLLARPYPPTAIFVANDNLAFNVVEELRLRGQRVPDDIAVIGFDDIEMASEITPPLTTVRIPLMEIGHRAADLVLDAAQADQGHSDPQAYTLPVELIHRGTASPNLIFRETFDDRAERPLAPLPPK
jgi:DNA-binding LacI/PurR family transcriptional regulator